MKIHLPIRLRLFDYIAAVLTLFIVVVFSLHSYGHDGVMEVRIRSAEETWIYPLGASVHLTVPGPLGSTEVSIGGGEVNVASSPCPEKICISSGPISSEGEWIACLPNRVFITISGSKKEQPDATTF